MEEGDTKSAEIGLEGHDKEKEMHYEDFDKQKSDQNEDSSDQMLEKEVADETKAPTEAKFDSQMEEAEKMEQEPPKSCIPVMSSTPPSVNLNEEKAPQIRPDCGVDEEGSEISAPPAGFHQYCLHPSKTQIWPFVTKRQIQQIIRADGNMNQQQTHRTAYASSAAPSVQRQLDTSE
ncbi:hypothetical protein ACLOJK_035119 [Asimina triloba]